MEYLPKDTTLLDLRAVIPSRLEVIVCHDCGVSWPVGSVALHRGACAPNQRRLHCIAQPCRWCLLETERALVTQFPELSLIPLADVDVVVPVAVRAARVEAFAAVIEVALDAAIARARAAALKVTT